MPELLDIVGQDEAVGRLERVLAAGRLPHALLLVGPRGVGRRTTALALAKTLLCPQPQTRPNAGRLPELDDDLPLKQACGHCTDCRLFAAGSHPDFHLIYKELAQYHDDPNVRGRKMQNLGIPVIRQFLIAPAGRAAARGRGRVFVVREAELLTAEAQNALLKTLEEPPAGVTIALICIRAEQLLATTRSRCWAVGFGRLPGAFVIEALAARGVGEAEAAFWAAFTDGSVGRALELAEGGLYAQKRELLDRLAAEGPEAAAELSEFLQKTAEKLTTAAVAAGKETDGAEPARLLASRRAAGTMLELTAGAFRDALIAAAGADLPVANADQPRAVAALAERFGPERLADILRQLAEYERLLWRNVNPKIVWDNVAITCGTAAPLRV